jgi:hypothetical protein
MSNIHLSLDNEKSLIHHRSVYTFLRKRNNRYLVCLVTLRHHRNHYYTDFVLDYIYGYCFNDTLYDGFQPKAHRILSMENASLYDTDATLHFHRSRVSFSCPPFAFPLGLEDSLAT